MRGGLKPHGFTLIEVLIALAVFSVMSIMAYGGLKTVLNARNGTERAAERLNEIQMAFNLIQQDMQHMVPRSIRDEYGQPKAAVELGIGGVNAIEFTRGGNNNPRRADRSTLYRVAYTWDESEGELQRLIWTTLDRANGNIPQKKVLLRGVSGLFIEEVGGIGGGSPPPGGGQANLDDLPRGIEMKLELEQWGTINRIFAMPY